ncbi:endoplasmic reticulum junction formation protein lunapark-A-like isoform X2 [Argonauta hians]
MGLIFSRSKKQKTTVEILEELDKNITKLQQFKRQNQEYQKKLIASLLLYSFFICLFAAIVIFLYYLPTTWKGWCFVFFPLILFIVLIWLVKKVLQWYYVKQISSNEQDLQELRSKKKAILEEVLENETYKVAKEIFEKFDPARFKKLEGDKTPDPKPGVRHRIVTTQVTPVIRMPPSQSHPMSALHSQPRFPPHTPASTSFQLNGSQRPVHSTYSPGPPMPRPVPPRDRTTFDKLVDYVVGEGPQNRYALICRYCHSHNGMAIKEEFEFISFRCCYCYYLNPAKKQRPQAPKLDILSPLPSSSNSPPQTSDSKLALTHEKQNLSSGPESDESPEENEGPTKKDAAASDAVADAADDDEYDDMTGEGISENKSEDECTTNTTEDDITEKETSEKSDTKDADNRS